MRIKEAYIAQTHRVVLCKAESGSYGIEVQEYAPDWPLQWEVQEDGWRTVSASYGIPFHSLALIGYNDTISREQNA